MAHKSEIKKSIENEIQHYDIFLKRIPDLNTFIPVIQERKKEAVLNLQITDSLSSESISLFGEELLEVQHRNEQRILSNLPDLPNIHGKELQTLCSSAGTVTTFINVVTASAKFEPGLLDADAPFWVTLNELSEEKSRKASLPIFLNELQPKLGDMFSRAIESYQKAKSGIIGIDQAAIHLRDVLEQIWGEIVNLSKKNCPKIINRNNRLALRKETHRKVVSECLGKDSISQEILANFLQSQADLHSDLSDRKFGKNPLTTDIKNLERIYGQWITLIDEICDFLKQNYKTAH